MTTALDPTTGQLPQHTRPDRILVIADHRPGTHRVDSDQIGWWLPILGPTSTILARTLAHHARRSDTEFVTFDLARRLGLGGSRSKLWQSLDRLHRFHCLTFVSTDIATIRLELPTLTPNQLTHLPDDMADAYRARFWR
jgi:hypothetical protein